MSEPFSHKAQSSMDFALHRPRPAMPFIEDVDVSDVEIKSEIKAEPDGRASPLFEPQQSNQTKRSLDDEIFVSDVKKPNVFTEYGPRAYGGGPLREYVSGTKYVYWKHEAVPELEVNSEHHQTAIKDFDFCINNVVLPALVPYKDEDKFINDIVDWYSQNAQVPAIPHTVFALLGSAGSGKTSTLNNLLGIPDLAVSDAAMESVTQTPQSFSHRAGQSTRFSVKVSFLNGRSIEILLRKCITDLVAYVDAMSDNDSDENGSAHDSAESSRQVLDDLFSHQNGLKELEDVEEFLEARELRVDGQISEPALQSLYQQIRERAFSEGIDLDAREVKFTASDTGGLHGQATIFSERGGFAPLVSSIRTQLHSPLLAMGIEIADLPGYSDTNDHLHKTSSEYLKECTKVIFVADLVRCMTTPEVKKRLRETIKLKGAENVILILRGKEIVGKSTGKWTKDERAHLEKLEKSLDVVKGRLDFDNESIASQAQAEAQSIEHIVRDYKMDVRDRVAIDQFSQKEYQNRYNNEKIRVITVANKCHEHYMRGTPGAILSPGQTGIKDLRAKLCEGPSDDLVRAFARHLANHINMFRRISIWADGPKMPPRDAAMALFEKYSRWSVEEFKALLLKAFMQYKRSLNTRFTDKWKEAIEKVIDRWIDIYAARTQGVFIRQGGRHTPTLKAKPTQNTTETKPKKSKIVVSWTENLLTVVEDDLPGLLKSVWDVINEVEAGICQNITDVVEKICHGLEMLDTIGGTNLDGVFELFKAHSQSCNRDVKDGIVELKTNLRSTVMRSVADEPCDEDSPVFVKEMSKIFGTTFAKFPPKSKNVTKERIQYIREQVLASKGPYAMMCNEASTQMVPVANRWADKTNSRVAKMFRDLSDVLFKSFEGKKMSNARREQIAFDLKLAMEKARSILQPALDGYEADIF